MSDSRTHPARKVQRSANCRSERIFQGAEWLWFNHARYDGLKRLSQASSAPQSGSTPAAWQQKFSYDGFGNLTGRTALNGVVSAIPVNAATNQLANQAGVLTNVLYDANGNLLSENGLTMTYDEANRVASATVSGGTEYYGYAPDNKRIYKMHTDGSEEWTFYGAKGEKLGTYQWGLNCTDWTDPTTCWYQPTVATTNVWFAGKLVWSGTSAWASGPAFTDRLGTNRASGARFYPYGDEITSTGNDRVKFGTYQRDAFSGMDYADQRYYASMYGRFNTGDPKAGSAVPNNPGSWNRYSYVGGDPANHNDPSGMDDQYCGPDEVWDGEGCTGGAGGSPPVLDPCTQIYDAVTGSVNCGSPVAPPPTPAQPTPASEPTCTVGLYERPAFFKKSPWGHTFLSVDCSDWASALTIDGDPGKIPVAGQPPTQSGWTHAPWLVGFISPAGTGPGHSNPAIASEIGPLDYFSGDGVVDQIMGSVWNYDYGGNVQPYVLFPFGSTTYNSNSFTYSPLQGFGLLNYFLPGGKSGLPISAPGWGNTVPDLGP